MGGGCWLGGVWWGKSKRLGGGRGGVGGLVR